MELIIWINSVYTKHTAWVTAVIRKMPYLYIAARMPIYLKLNTLVHQMISNVFINCRRYIFVILWSWHAGGDILHTKAFTFPMPTFYAGKIDEMWYLYKLRLTFLANSILHFVTLTITKHKYVCLFSFLCLNILHHPGGIHN